MLPMTSKKLAVVSAAGIGDALVLLIASHHLRKMGCEVTTFNRHLPGFGRWLEKGEYLPPPADWRQALASFDAVLLQHDNTEKAREIVSLRKSGLPVYVFYTNYRFSKHGALLDGFDYAFDANQTMVDNTCRGTSALFGGETQMFNGLYPPPCLVHRKFPRRVMIHPTSTCNEKNWLKKKFLKLAKHLQAMDFQPTFILSLEERADWPELHAPIFPTLEDLASMIYESGYFIGNDSGPGHLASYLSIPHLIIRRHERNMQLWRPGWHQGELICPPRWLPNIKGLRIREQKWKHFITTKEVLKRFKTLIEIKANCL
jgi:heptosyltransferase III